MGCRTHGVRAYMLRESGKCTLLHFARTELELDEIHGVLRGVWRVLTAGGLAGSATSDQLRSRSQLAKVQSPGVDIRTTQVETKI